MSNNKDTMKAAVWYRARDLRVEPVEIPRLKDPHQVKIRVAACGICGSDLHEYAAGPIFIPVDAPHPISQQKAPIIMGHEFAGEVVEVGERVTRVKMGDRVAIEPILSPHRDGHYLMERYNLTPLLGFHGLSGGGGETVVVSIWESDAAIQPNDLVIKERSMKGIIAYRHIYPAVIALMQQGYFRAEDLITGRIALDDIVEKGFDTLLNDKSHVKIIVGPAT